MIAIGQPVSLTIKVGHHAISLDRIEANPLHVLVEGCAPGSFFYKLTVDGTLRMFRQDPVAVQKEFRETCRLAGLVAYNKKAEVSL